jgi:hypothetical protein
VGGSSVLSAEVPPTSKEMRLQIHPQAFHRRSVAACDHS